MIDAAGLKKIHLVGHSYGGATAIRYALLKPISVLSLTLIEPILMTLLRNSEHGRLFDEYYSIASGFMVAAARGEPEAGWKQFLDYRNGEGTWARISEEVKARFLASTPNNVAGYKSNLSNPTTLHDLEGIHIRTLVVCGSKATLPDRTVSEIVRNHLPICNYALLEGAEHMSPITHPKELASLIEEHIVRSDAIRRLHGFEVVNRLANAGLDSIVMTPAAFVQSARIYFARFVSW